MIPIDANLPAQGTLGWHRARLGKFTGSEIHRLMVGSKIKGEDFGQTAKSYILKVMAERHITFDVVENDDEFYDYLEATSVETKRMAWGKEQEDKARQSYEIGFGVDVVQCGSVKHIAIPNYAASPDGYIASSDKIIEIKCPNPVELMRYMAFVHDAESLKAIKPEYYWQVQAELDCTFASVCDFVVYNKWMTPNMHVAEIRRNDEDIERIHERIALAEAWAKENIK